MKREPEQSFAALREKAEQLLKNQPSLLEKPYTKDLSKVIHDLQVHQIELEMQNDELKKVQADLESSKDRYFKLFNRAPVGYATVDEVGMIRSSNQALSDMLGRDPRVLKRKPLSQFVFDKDKDLFLSRFRVFSRKPDGGSFEVRMVESSRQIIHTQLSVQAVDTQSKTQNGSRDILIVVSDITEKKRAEKKLRQNKDLLNNIVEDIPAMICRFDDCGTISFVNKEYCAFFDRTENYFLNKNYFSLLPENKREYVKDQFSKLTPEDPVKTYEYEARTVAKETRWQRWMIRAIFESSGDVLFYQTIGYDITEQLQIQNEKKEKEKLTGIVELAGAICHEIRQPLQVIVGVSDLVAMKTPGDQSLEKEFSLLLREVDRINVSRHQLDNITRYETKPYIGKAKILDLNNTSDRRKDKRYKPAESVFVKFIGDDVLKVRLIDISKGGLSFWGKGINLKHGPNFSCDILKDSGERAIHCLPCILIPEDLLKQPDLKQARHPDAYHAQFIDLSRDQIEQISKFIREIVSR